MSVFSSIGEQVADFTRNLTSGSWFSFNGVRSLSGRILGAHFWTNRPPAENSQVNYDLLRSFYRNDSEWALGTSFSKPIVDMQVGYVGIPRAQTPNQVETEFLNECLQQYWAGEIQQLFRDSIRDSKVIVKMSKPDILDPLMTIEEARHCMIELIPPELVEIEYSLTNRNIIERAVIHRQLVFITDPGDPTQGEEPKAEEHDVLEIITRDSYRYYDQDDEKWLDSIARPNPTGFVPVLEVFNEYDASLKGGMSDLETAIPFMKAFHSLLSQGLQSHSYHSTPKVVFKLSDVEPFIRSNFPEVLDPETGMMADNAEVNWKGREIIFLSDVDDAKFLEAKSILGDTQSLAQFLIDCICIASQTPEWAFMRVDAGSANSDRNAQTVPLLKKIERKRKDFSKPIQDLLKMVMVFNELIPSRASITWEVIRTDDLVVQMQAFQQLVMGLEVARQRGEISDDTYQSMLKMFLPVMGSNLAEKSEPDPPQPALPPGQFGSGGDGQKPPPKQPAIRSQD